MISVDINKNISIINLPLCLTRGYSNNTSHSKGGGGSRQCHQMIQGGGRGQQQCHFFVHFLTKFHSKSL